MTSVRRQTARGALVFLASAALVACASHPKPAPPVASAPPPPPPPPYSAPYSAPAAPVSQQPTGPVPGSVQDFVIHAGDRVYFDFDKYQIRDDGLSSLVSQAAWLRRYPQVMVRIEGNTDEQGTREYNFALGARRAASVKDYLVAHGVSPSRIETVSYGKEHPIALGSTEDDYAKNRNAHTAITSGAQ